MEPSHVPSDAWVFLIKFDVETSLRDSVWLNVEINESLLKNAAS